jgi:hypothetical protein
MMVQGADKVFEIGGGGLAGADGVHQVDEVRAAAPPVFCGDEFQPFPGLGEEGFTV